MSTETATAAERQHVGLGTLARRGLVAVFTERYAPAVLV